MTTPTAIHCPSCDRYLMEAEEVKAGKLRCKGCRHYLIVDLNGGELTIKLLEPGSASRAPAHPIA